MTDYPIIPLSGSATDTVDWLNAQGPSTYGRELEMPDGRVFKYAYWDASAPAACALGNWVFIGRTGKTTYAYNPAIAAVATAATIPQQIGVVCQAKTAAGGVWVQTKGPCAFCILEGTDNIAIGDQLQCVNAQVYVVKDGGATMTIDSVAVAGEAYTTDAASSADKTAYLHGRAATVGGT